MCGVFGVYGNESCLLANNGAKSLKHRGKDGAGEAGVNFAEQRIRRQRGRGSVEDILDLNNPEMHRMLDSNAAMSHTRYPTAGSNKHEETQPHISETSLGKIVLCSNGDLVNLDELKIKIRDSGRKVDDVQNDAAVLVQYIAMLVEKRGMCLTDAIAQSMKDAIGSYSAMLLSEFSDCMYFFRDQHGVRPYEWGETSEGNTICTSEWCALNNAGAIYNRSVHAGELLIRHPSRIEEIQVLEKCRRAFCVFEIIYLSRPDSRFYYDEEKGLYVSYEILRESIGRRAAQERNIEADVVVGVPLSGLPGALGFANELGIPCRQGIIINPLYVHGRTFITDSIEERSQLSGDKYLLIEDVFRGKDVVFYDDSTVKGLTMRRLVKLAREAGARKVHVVLGSPMIKDVCFLGIETKKVLQLVSREGSIDIARRRIGEPNSLNFISIKGLFDVIMESTGQSKENFCSGCLDGNYPIPKPEHM